MCQREIQGADQRRWSDVVHNCLSGQTDLSKFSFFKICLFWTGDQFREMAVLDGMVKLNELGDLDEWTNCFKIHLNWDKMKWK